MIDIDLDFLKEKMTKTITIEEKDIEPYIESGLATVKKMLPMNIKILVLTPQATRILGEVKTVDIFKQNSKEFHPDGLFSTTIFGEVGSKDRLTRFGYIRLGIKILHPRIYAELTSLSSLYKSVLEGKKYVKFDEKLKNFVEVDKLEGETGYNVFYKYWDKLKFERNDSINRLFKILFIEKSTREEAFMDKLVVIPAGLRDYIETETGKVLENEINDYYRRVLSTSATAKQFTSDTNETKFLATVRTKVQKSVNDVYNYLENLLDGKEKFIQGKWTKRAIAYGTRNVITGSPKEIKDLNDPYRPKPYSGIVGVYQAAKGLLPITIYQLRTKFLNKVISPEVYTAPLIDPKTYKIKIVNLTEKTRTSWINDDGVEKIINKTVDDNFKNSPVILDDYYLYLVYEDNNKIDIVREPKDGMDMKKLRPITYGELIFLSLFDIIDDYPAYITRYPITGYGSVVPVIPYLKSTVKGRRIDVRLPNSLEYKTTGEYPIIGTEWFNSLSIPTIYLEGLGADFDGDKVSMNFVWKEESKKEVKDLLFSKNFILNQAGQLSFSPATLNNKIMLSLMTE